MKLTKQQVADIKADIKRKVPQSHIAMAHNCSRSIISDIATERAHADVPWPGGKPGKKTAGGQHKPLYDPTDTRVQELEAEVEHLREERNLAKKAAKAGAQDRGLFKAIVGEMEQRIKPFDALPAAKPAKTKATIEEHVVMHLSDGHHDQIVRPEECGNLEEYNFPISCRRAERYVDTVIDWTQSTLRPKFNFQTLTVLAYGDHTSGEIHDHEKRSYFRNQFRNCFAIAQLHAMMYRDLAPHFDKVNVVYLPGNHGRRTPKKEHQGAQNNWDYMIAEAARMHCRDIENIDFLIPDAFSVNLVINGVGFNISHGDDIKGHQGIPWYGMVRRQKGLIALGAAQGGQRIRYFCCGHHHIASSLADVDGEMIVNGAWLGTDAYAYNSFAGYREPSQWLHGVHPRHGVTWRLAVHLRHADEKKGPQRYKISV